MEKAKEGESELILRVKQLENEKEVLQKDIEQLCTQQSGPAYLLLATRMHFQRTASLEQDIENLKGKLAACTRQNLNLQEELSEAHHVKSQLSDMHKQELSKNKEAEKQVKFFQSCMASAFAERDHSLMEALNAKEREEAMQVKMNDMENRFGNLSEELIEEKAINSGLRNELRRLKECLVNVEKVVEKFYNIRQAGEGSSNLGGEYKALILIQDPAEFWSYTRDGGSRVAKYIDSLEEELEESRNTNLILRGKLNENFEAMDLLQERLLRVEEANAHVENALTANLVMIHEAYNKNRDEISLLLREGRTSMQSLIDEFQEKLVKLGSSVVSGFDARAVNDVEYREQECKDVHVNHDTASCETDEVRSSFSHNNSQVYSYDARAFEDISDALKQALQEKVSVLLLLSQQEERYLLERNVHIAREKKMQDLQRNLNQVTTEKVKALMELAQLKQDYLLLQESSHRGTLPHELQRDGRFKGLLKRTSLTHFINIFDATREKCTSSRNSNYALDFARLRVDNASLHENMASIDHLTSCIRKLRVSLTELASTSSTVSSNKSVLDALDNIITEASLVKTALGSSLPVSWSPDDDDVGLGSPDSSLREESLDDAENKIDCVSAAGFEMVELLIMAAQLQKACIIAKDNS